MPKNILVIDDEAAVRKSFVLALEDTDYQVDLAESGYKGLEMLEQKNYRLIFLDLKMPGLNGVETLRRIRAIDKKVLVYIITAFYGEYLEELKKLTQEGIEYQVLRKPIDSDQILTLTQITLDQDAEEGNV